MASLGKRMVHLCDYHLFRVSGGACVRLHVLVHTETRAPMNASRLRIVSRRTRSIPRYISSNDRARARARAMEKGRSRSDDIFGARTKIRTLLFSFLLLCHFSFRPDRHGVRTSVHSNIDVEVDTRHRRGNIDGGSLEPPRSRRDYKARMRELPRGARSDPPRRIVTA